MKNLIALHPGNITHERAVGIDENPCVETEDVGHVLRELAEYGYTDITSEITTTKEKKNTVIRYLCEKSQKGFWP